MASQDFSLYSGDSMQLNASIVDENNAPVDLTGATIKWVLANDTATVLSKSIGNGITITNAAQGQCAIAITSVDTQILSGSYTHAARLINGSESKIVFTGAVTISKAIV